jgi:transposase
MRTRFLPYNPDQAYLLPPNVKDVLGQDHLVFFVHGVVERLDLEAFTRAYREEGGALYAPELMLKVWLYAYVLGVTSARRLEQRIREDLAFRYLAGGSTPDNWALSAFRRKHGRGINDVFTQVLELAQSLGLARLGHVALDSTRVRGAASRDRMDTETKLRRERARLRRQIRPTLSAVRFGPRFGIEGGHPGGKGLPVIGAGHELPGLRGAPVSGVGGMASRQHSGAVLEGDADDFGLKVGGHPEFVADGAAQQVAR